MRIRSLACFAAGLLLSPRGAFASKRSYDTHIYYVLEHTPHGASLADVTEALGVQVVEPAGQLVDHWLVRVEQPPLAARSESSDPVLRAYEDLKTRAEDSSHPSRRSNLHAREVVSSIKYLSRQIPRQRVKRAPPPPVSPVSDSSARAVAQRLGITDPLFSQQWHLVNDEHPEHMMNVTGLWEMGITGKGVISSLVDDGLDYTSSDLEANFDAADSWDYNDHVPLPTPKKYDDTHGTRCAGQVAAGKNSACGIGIAYESKVAGVRILSGPISDVDEAAALNHGFQNVSIYSCSWGPPDNGRTMEGPNYLIKKAVLNGINHGRGGKGSIFVFASGNGAASGDQCNFDGYTNSIYSVTVSAIDHEGNHPYYSEPCAANMIVAYSSGGGKYIVTCDRGKDKCADTHGGTSAAAPNAVGVFALALQARPDFTWRDVQHLCVETARMVNKDDPDWERTAAGRPYSYKYGFGALDAYRYVKAAQDWTLVKPQAWFETTTVVLNNGAMNSSGNFTGGQFLSVPGGLRNTISITPEMLTENNFEKLEHINVKVWIDHTRRGDVEVEILSPNGVKSVLGGKRTGDKDTTGYPGWLFMSVKHWGEDPVGDWTLRVSDQMNEYNGSLLGWNMMFWGSTIDPSKAKQYEIPMNDTILPPLPYSATLSATTTKTYVKPTAFLTDVHSSTSAIITGTPHPGNEDVAQSTASPSASSSPDWVDDVASIVSAKRWTLVFVGGVIIAALVGLFMWRRHLRRARYTALPEGEDSRIMDGPIMLTARSGGLRDDEFHDVPVDDDDDANEETRLRPAIGFHSGFLDDDEASTAGIPSAHYRDEPEGQAKRGTDDTTSR